MPPDGIVQKYDEIEQILTKKGISKEQSAQKWLEEALRMARQELAETVRQQEMIFKFTWGNGKFIHTLCDGELLYRMGLNPEQVIVWSQGDRSYVPSSLKKVLMEELSRAIECKRSCDCRSEIIIVSTFIDSCI